MTFVDSVIDAALTRETIAVVWLTLRVATVATLVIAVPATLLGYTLARRSFPGKATISALTNLPLVLPPTAIGFLFLSLLAVDGPLGRDAIGFDLDILLTWRAAALASATMSFPLVARTTRIAFEGVDPRLEMAARTLGYGPVATFVRFSLPLAWRGLLAGMVLGFTRALGEFGASVTIAGNIPGQTRTLASAIFSAQQSGDEARAGAYILISITVGLTAVIVAELLAGRAASGSRRQGLSKSARS